MKVGSEAFRCLAEKPEMSNPDAAPKAQGEISRSRKSRGRILKHACLFLVIFLILNFDRLFGSPERVAGVPEVSMAARVMTLLLFYGAGYLILSRVRSRR